MGHLYSSHGLDLGIRPVTQSEFVPKKGHRRLRRLTQGVFAVRGNEHLGGELHLLDRAAANLTKQALDVATPRVTTAYPERGLHERTVREGGQEGDRIEDVR